MTFLAVLATAALLAAAGYAHYRIPFHTAGRARALVAHAGFGAVHLPAAIILFLKRAGGAGKS
jgi:hypothetical protein